MSRSLQRKARDYAAGPSAPPEADLDRVVYGAVQPLVGLKLLFRHPELLKMAILPTLLLALLCVLFALEPDKDISDSRYFWVRFYQAFGATASLPSVLFARRYARMAAEARNLVGLGPVEPLYESFWIAVVRLIKQALAMAIALLPLTGLVALVPFVGRVALSAIGAVWALHWIVVDAFDSARVLRPGQSVADAERLAEEAPPPWFVRLSYQAASWRFVGWAFRHFARLSDWLSKPWREEIALIEAHPSLLLGFALATALLLVIPGLNLLFRSVGGIAASHVLGRLEPPPPPEPPTAAHETPSVAAATTSPVSS